MPIAADMAAKFPAAPITHLVGVASPLENRVANIWQNLGQRQIFPPKMVVSSD